MVEVHDGSGVLPVDEHAVLLPTQDFTIENAERYPRIGEIYSAPPEVVGRRWGDAAVLGGAQIAAAIGSDWNRLGLKRVVPVERKSGPQWLRVHVSPVHALWARPSIGAAPRAPICPAKCPPRKRSPSSMRYLLQNGGTLDGENGPHAIVIDHTGALLRKDRPEIEPLPPVSRSRLRSASDARVVDDASEEEPD